LRLPLWGVVEPTVRYHSGEARILTGSRSPALEQFQVGSLTGAVASKGNGGAQKVSLSGNRAQSVKKVKVTARATTQAGTKSALVIRRHHGRAVAQRIKLL